MGLMIAWIPVLYPFAAARRGDYYIQVRYARARGGRGERNVIVWQRSTFGVKITGAAVERGADGLRRMEKAKNVRNSEIDDYSQNPPRGGDRVPNGAFTNQRLWAMRATWGLRSTHGGVCCEWPTTSIFGSLNLDTTRGESCLFKKDVDPIAARERAGGGGIRDEKWDVYSMR